MLHRNFLLILSPCCFAVCGHRLPPRIAIVFSLRIYSIAESWGGVTGGRSNENHDVPKKHISPCVYTPYLVLITMFTHHIWSWLLCLHTIFGWLLRYLVLITMFTHHIWSWLLCIHTIFGPDYYVYTPYLVLITIFTHHIWSWLRCFHTIFGPDYYAYTAYLVLITIYIQHIWSWLLCLHSIFDPDYYAYTAYLVLNTMFTHQSCPDYYWYVSP